MEGWLHGVALRSCFEIAPGAQAPAGFWDPTSVGMNSDVADSKRRRETHGEQAAMAPGRFWDPAAYAAIGSTDNPAHPCQTEIKQGRIAMLAA
eukprot:12013585-Heterocapsa_arctica.AAC.1